MRFPVRKVAEQVAVVGIVAAIVGMGLSAWRPVRVTGSSMNPALYAGDLVLVHKDARIDVRDVVLYQESGHGPVLHRVIAREGADAIRTKGDANSTADRDPVPVGAVVGPVRVVLHVGSLVAWWRRR